MSSTLKRKRTSEAVLSSKRKFEAFLSSKRKIEAKNTACRRPDPDHVDYDIKSIGRSIFRMRKFRANLPCGDCIKNQGCCSMCWAIVAADSFAIGRVLDNPNKKFFGLSSSELNDCANPKKLHTDKCYLYSRPPAYEYMMEKGAVKEDVYPFSIEKKPCKIPRTPTQEKSTIYLKSFGSIEDNLYDSMEFEFRVMEQVLKYPVGAAIYTDPEFENLKKDDIWIPIPPPKNADGKYDIGGVHAILIIGWGYDRKKKIRFWLFKNSYGESWSDGGFGRVIRHSSLLEGEASIHSVSWPIFYHDELDEKRGPSSACREN